MKRSYQSKRKTNRTLKHKSSIDTSITGHNKSSDLGVSTQYESAPPKMPKGSEDEAIKYSEAGSDGRTLTNTTLNSQDIKQPRFNRLISIVRVVKIELLVGLLGLLIALGQYFQSGIAVRMSITSIWREGYTADTRSRVTKFRHLYKTWETRYGYYPVKSVRKMVFPEKLFKTDFIKEDEFIKELVSDEIALLKRDKRGSANEEYKPTNEDYIQAVLKYRNAIMDCLNTAEAVKAVIEARPLPFRFHLFYSDTLEGRYRDIISELTRDLESFIRFYRVANPRKEKGQTEAWYVLDAKESGIYDYFIFFLLVFVLFVSLTIIYFIKKPFKLSRKLRPQNTKT